jgi:hypothetical protein
MEFPETGFEGGWVVEGGVPRNHFDVGAEFDELGAHVDGAKQ